jgi:arginine decarboxylase
MPGHKYGRCFPDALKSYAARLDITEIPGFDNLHAPAGILRTAQEHTAEVFGARQSYYLVNGSTVGIQTMIMATCRRGETLIAARNCHKSVINTARLAGLKLFLVNPRFNGRFAVSTEITADAVELALKKTPDAGAVLVTSPTFHGVCSDLRAIADVVHSYGKVLLVDEAHGAHLNFNERLPDSALAQDADMCVQSAHKTLPAFTQSALLHIGSTRVDPETVFNYLTMLQTTSPSYILMASLDFATGFMETEGRERLTGLLDSVRSFRAETLSLGRFQMLGEWVAEVDSIDSTRIVVDCAEYGRSGTDLAVFLGSHANIQVEMQELSSVVCILTAVDEPEVLGLLLRALKDFHEQNKSRYASSEYADFSLEEMEFPFMPTFVPSWRRELVSLRDSVGEIAADMLFAYPPGIPLAYPGERINHSAVSFIERLKASGIVIQGLSETGEVSVARK